MGIVFEEKLVNSHVIEDEQVHFAKVERGIGNKFDLNFSYNSLSKNYNGLYEELVESLIEIIVKIPHGVLIIFPSYRMIEEFRRYG